MGEDTVNLFGNGIETGLEEEAVTGNGRSFFRSVRLPPFQQAGKGKGTQSEDRNGQKEKGKIVPVDKENGESWGYSQGKIRCKHKVCQSLTPVCLWNDIDNKCKSGCIQTGECSTLHNPNGEEGPERMKENESERSQSEY
jgi:hypothetical protein